MAYSGVTEDAVRDLVHGAIFTRGPKDLHNTAIFIGGTDMSVGERMLAKVKKAFFGPMRVSVMLDSNGSNTTAVAAVARIQQTLGGDVTGTRVVVLAGSGPVGIRAAGLLAKAGAQVTVTTRRAVDGSISKRIQERFGVSVREVTAADVSGANAALDGAEVFLSAGPAGVCLVPKDAWMGRAGLKVAVDVNAVPPLGVEGIEVTDNKTDRGGVTTFGALGVGNLKMKIHKACIAKLFEKNDQVLDAETIAEIASTL